MAPDLIVLLAARQLEDDSGKNGRQGQVHHGWCAQRQERGMIAEGAWEGEGWKVWRRGGAHFPQYWKRRINMGE